VPGTVSIPSAHRRPERPPRQGVQVRACLVHGAGHHPKSKCIWRGQRASCGRSGVACRSTGATGACARRDGIATCSRQVFFLPSWSTGWARTCRWSRARSIPESSSRRSGRFACQPRISGAPRSRASARSEQGRTRRRADRGPAPAQARYFPAETRSVLIKLSAHIRWRWHRIHSERSASRHSCSLSLPSQRAAPAMAHWVRRRSDNGARIPERWPRRSKPRPNARNSFRRRIFLLR
jgi:hypothetical protein